MINSLYAHSLTLAANGAWNRANMDLVVARVEDDILEIDAPPVDNDLGVGVNEADAIAAVVDGGDQSGGSGGSETASEIDVSEVDSILTDDGDVTDSTMSHISTDPSTEDDDDDDDSIISGEHEAGLPAKAAATGLTRTIVNAIVDDDQSAEADANAEVEIIENRLDESVPWEEYKAPASDDDDDDDGDKVESTLRPVERAQLLFETNLMGRLRTFDETGVAEPLLIQGLSHG